MEKVQTTASSQDGQTAPRLAAAEDTCCVRLSDRDTAAVLAAADRPPAPNAAALKAAQRFLQKHG